MLQLAYSNFTNILRKWNYKAGREMKEDKGSAVLFADQHQDRIGLDSLEKHDFGVLK